MKTKVKSIFLISMLVTGSIYLLVGCKCNDDPQINSFEFRELSPPVSGSVNNSAKNIDVILPDSVDKTSLMPTITVDPECYTLSPASGVAQDFTNPVLYEVKNEKGDVATFRVNISSGEPVQNVQVDWQERNPLPFPLGWNAVVEMDGIIYVIGGATNGTDVTDKVLAYNPQSDTWDDGKAPLNLLRAFHTANVVDGKIYVMGGIPSGSGNTVNSMEVYNPDEDEWTAFGSMPQKTAAHASAVVDGKIYIMGGEPKEPPTEDITYDEVYVYDPVEDTWTELSPLLEARCWFSASVVDGKIYTFGGVNNSSSYVYDNIFQYDPETDAWEEKISMNVTRWGAGTCTLNDHIFIVGGFPTSISQPLTTVEVFSPMENTMMSASKFLQPVSEAAVCAFQGGIFVAGGSLNGAPYDQIDDLVVVGDPVWK